jgi:hypothetical protein
MRQVSRVYFLNIGMGVMEFLLGVGLTGGTYLLARNGVTGGWFILFYGLIFGGGAHIVLAWRRLRVEMELQRRMYRERLSTH